MRTSSPREVNDFLYFVMTHELAHVFDFANTFNSTVNCPEPRNPDDDPECAMATGSWGAIGWLTNQRPKPENDFANRASLCFYTCKTLLEPRLVSRLYRDLSGTNFISAYATTQPWDDFADSVAYWMMRENLGTQYILNTGGGERYDIMAKLGSERFAPKAAAIREFFSRRNLVYP